MLKLSAVEEYSEAAAGLALLMRLRFASRCRKGPIFLWFFDADAAPDFVKSAPFEARRREA
jgi:hypothetical protein